MDIAKSDHLSNVLYTNINDYVNFQCYLALARWFMGDPHQCVLLLAVYSVSLPVFTQKGGHTLRNNIRVINKYLNAMFGYSRRHFVWCITRYSDIYQPTGRTNLQRFSLTGENGITDYISFSMACHEGSDTKSSNVCVAVTPKFAHAQLYEPGRIIKYYFNVFGVFNSIPFYENPTQCTGKHSRKWQTVKEVVHEHYVQVVISIPSYKYMICIKH